MLEESDNGFHEFDTDFFNRLDEDEILVLEELLDSVDFYIEIGYPFIFLCIPLVICCIKRRL